MRDSMVFYKSFYEAIKDLPPKQYKEAMNAIFAYALEDQEIKVGAVANSIFLMAKPQIDANNRRYANGCKGGRPVKHEGPKKNAFTKIENSDVDFEELGKKVFKN